MNKINQILAGTKGEDVITQGRGLSRTGASKGGGGAFMGGSYSTKSFIRIMKKPCITVIHFGTKYFVYIYF